MTRALPTLCALPTFVAVAVVGGAVASLGCWPAQALTPVADFGDNPGALDMLEHVPPAATSPMPVVLALHGCSQDSDYADDTGLTALADEFGFGLVVAEQRASNNGQRCFNWFEEGDIDSGAGEAASLANMVRSFLARHDADADRVFVTGLSSGGAMTAVLLAVEPDLFAAGASFAGIAYRCGVGVFAAFGCQGSAPDRSQAAWAALVTDHVDRDVAADGPWPRLLVIQGEADGTVAFNNSAALALQWSGLHALPAAPTSTTTDGPRTTRRWIDGDRTVVETVAIAGMGHGTPIDPPSCGRAAPFIVDEDFCGSRAALEFFGIVSSGEGEGEGAEGEGEAVAEGEGEAVAEGEGEAVAEGEGEAVAEGEGEALYPGDSCACAASGNGSGGANVVVANVVVGGVLLLAAQRRRKRTISSVVRSPG